MEKHAGDQGRIQSLIAGMKSPVEGSFGLQCPFPPIVWASALRVRCKICGITSLEDAISAVTCGADALGFMFVEASVRHIGLSDASAIASELPPMISRVGVFVNAPRQTILEAVQSCGLHAIQLHGEETPEDCQGYPVPVIKAFRVRDKASVANISAYAGQTWLVDSYQKGSRGGTGHRFEWDLLDEIRPFARPLLLAGGLQPGNIREAVEKVRPYGVDVSSGVESDPGKKCPLKMKAFTRELGLVGV